MDIKHQTVFINKCKTSVEVEATELPAHVQEYIFEYGLRQILNDCHSSEKEPDAAMALVLKKIDALMAGTIKAGRTSANPFDKWLQDKLVDLVAAQQGCTKKDAKATLVKLAKEPTGQIVELFKDDHEKAIEQFKAAWDKEQAAKTDLLGSLGTIKL